MFVIGLTGGIGSGKSLVANLFAERGAPIIDADVIAREITLPGTRAFQKIVTHFGDTILLPNGGLNRSKLRGVIFENSKERLWLEGILHPIIRKEMEQQIQNVKAPYCIAVIPLLLEVEFYSFINRILVVDAPYELQVERTIARDKTSKADIEAILKTQANRHERLKRAQDVIDNDRDIAHLIPQIDELHKKYLQMGSQNSEGS